MRRTREYFQSILNTVARAHILLLQRVQSQEIAPRQRWHSHLARLNVSDGSLNSIIFRKYWVLPWCVMGLMLYAHPSQAELRYSFLCQDVSSCSELAKEARSLSKKKNLQEAQHIYQHLYQTRPDPNLAFDIARVLEKQDRFQDAIPFYLTCIDSPFCLPELQVLARSRVLGSHPVRDRASSDSAALPVRPPPGSLRTLAHAARINSSARPPLYKRWWLWTLVGVAVVSAGVTGGLIKYADRPTE